MEWRRQVVEPFGCDGAGDAGGDAIFWIG